MKSMTCRDLGGACEKVFSADTFEEIAEMSKRHGVEMMQMADPAHLKAMELMNDLMKDKGALTAWYEAKRRKFENLPLDESIG